MEQIQQHEWEKHEDYMSLKICKHCKCRRAENIIKPGEVTYREPYSHFTSKEPACITRYPEQNISKFEQAIKDTAEEAGKL